MAADMDAQVIDLQISGLVETHPDWFEGLDEDRKRSRGFVLMAIARSQGISYEEALESLTDGPDDAGVDGVVIGEVTGGEFPVIIYQAKYKKSLNGSFAFPETSVKQVFQAATFLFDPNKELHVNDQLKPKIEEVRSRVREGFIPQVQIICCNNGEKWGSVAQAFVDQVEKDYSGLKIKHLDHHMLMQLGRNQLTPDVKIGLTGKILVEDQVFKRFLIGRVNVREIVRIFKEHGDLLLQRNVHRFLGLRDNQVNQNIQRTLLSENPDQFYFFNNGITVVCSNFAYNNLQQEDFTVTLREMQIINGGQTCKTIYETLKDRPIECIPKADLLIRVYQVDESDKNFVQDITYATNSQSPIDWRDLRSNSKEQIDLEAGLKVLGFKYRRQRDAMPTNSADEISPPVLAEAVLSIWRRMPHRGRFFRKEHFGILYDQIFQNLNASQALLAVLIFRKVEGRRRAASETSNSAPVFLPYASNYIAMLVGDALLRDLGMTVDGLDHRTLPKAREYFEEKFDVLYDGSIRRIEKALEVLYGNRQVTLQQLSATFRRGDLLEGLEEIKQENAH